MNPLDFMSVALRLSMGDEASRRTAISRAYYCAYHVARKLITDCGVCFAGHAATHEQLPWCLQQSGDAGAQRAGSGLKALRGVRNDADYALESGDFTNAKYVALQLQQAQEVITALSGISPTAIVATVRQYASTVLRLPLVDV